MGLPGSRGGTRKTLHRLGIVFHSLTPRSRPSSFSLSSCFVSPLSLLSFLRPLRQPPVCLPLATARVSCLVPFELSTAFDSFWAELAWPLARAQTRARFNPLGFALHLDRGGLQFGINFLALIISKISKLVYSQQAYRGEILIVQFFEIAILYEYLNEYLNFYMNIYFANISIFFIHCEDSSSTYRACLIPLTSFKRRIYNYSVTFRRYRVSAYFLDDGPRTLFNRLENIFTDLSASIRINFFGGPLQFRIGSVELLLFFVAPMCLQLLVFHRKNDPVAQEAR